MAVIGAVEEARGRKGNILQLGGGDLERSFIVKTDNTSTNQYDIYRSGLIPYQGTSHPLNFVAILKQIEFEPIEKFLWRVSCKYSTRPDGQEERQRLLEEGVVPWLLPAIITGSYLTERTEKSVDLDGKAIATSAGTPYTPPLTTTRPDSGLFGTSQPYAEYTIRKNFPAMPAFFESFADIVNQDNLALYNPLGRLTILVAGTVQYHPVSFSEVKFAGPGGSLSFIELTYKFSRTPQSKASINLVDRGPHFKDGFGNPQPFNEGGEFFLDGFGNRLINGASPVSNSFKIGQTNLMGGLIPTS
jgi:hypothetical protein